jgi:hypothetical protein
MFLLNSSLFSQTNLIQNSSFEEFTNLHNQTYEGMFEVYTPSLVHILDNWERIYSADHFDTSFAQNGFGAPHNIVGNSYPKHGHAYVGAICFSNNGAREYIFQHLNSPLKTDSVYCMSFFVSRADGIKHAIKSLGAYFSSTSPPQTLPLGYINATPQIVNTNDFITDTIGWTEIQGCFTAQGGEQYVTIGNFNSNANTDTLFVGSTSPISYADGYGYYYFDSITLWQNNLPTVLKNEIKENVISVYPNPAKDVLNINLGTITKNAKIEIYNAVGELMLTENLAAQHSSLPTHSLLSGIYFYHILVNGKIINSYKIVIIK